MMHCDAPVGSTLSGAYLSRHAAELFAKRHFTHPEDQKKFVALVSEAIADSVARGDFLPRVRLREREADREREAARVLSVEREPHRIPS